MALRDLTAPDRAPVERILRATGVFTEEEVAVALELVDAGLAPSSGDGYRFLVAEDEGGVAGYACWGATPLAEGTHDLYWIAVDPARSGRGIGTALLSAVERSLRAEGGRLLIAETAGKAAYDGTRAFYLARGYREEARIADFYREGDDKVVYVKRLQGG